MSSDAIAGSFRDPSGFLFTEDGLLFRQVNASYRADYDHLMASGLYRALVDAGLLVAHEEVSLDYGRTEDAYRVIKPQEVPFVSYPYEWCFSQLKDAALATLRIQKAAMDYGMTLKDGSAYNIQFLGTRPALIDTLSFERYREGQIWVAYRQFCQHFLAPLALMSYRDVRLSQLLRVYIDGIPLDLASKLLPVRSRVKFSLLSHIHLHAKSQERFADSAVDTRGRGMSKMGFLGLVDSLESTIRGLKWRPAGTEWGDYYEDTNYTEEAREHKRRLVAEYLEEIGPESVWDLGANTGLFSRVASERGVRTVAFDVDPAAVETNYVQCASQGETNLLPLVLDLTNPSPGLGWAGEERMSLVARGPADAALALALVHHLAISNNLPFSRIAEFFSRICRYLVIEFVPKRDSQVQRLLTTREDIFTDYTEEAFEAAFGERFGIRRCERVSGSERSLYLMDNGRRPIAGG